MLPVASSSNSPVVDAVVTLTPAPAPDVTLVTLISVKPEPLLIATTPARLPSMSDSELKIRSVLSELTVVVTPFES